jgi:hypothetical protein
MTDTPPQAAEEDLRWPPWSAWSATPPPWSATGSSTTWAASREEITGNARGDDPSWDVGADQTIGGVIAEFESACAASRQIAADFTLDQAVPHDQLGQVSLRFIYMNIISEHARHAGHADILREQIDGVTGD